MEYIPVAFQIGMTQTLSHGAPLGCLRSKKGLNMQFQTATAREGEKLIFLAGNNVFDACIIPGAEVEVLAGCDHAGTVDVRGPYQASRWELLGRSGDSIVQSVHVSELARLN